MSAERSQAQMDADLELQIDAAYRRMCKAIQQTDKTAAWTELVDLVRRRSPEQIRKMERERRIG